MISIGFNISATATNMATDERPCVGNGTLLDHDVNGHGLNSSSPSTGKFTIAALYKFSHLHTCTLGELKLKIRAAAGKHRIFGMLLLAEEGSFLDVEPG